MIAHAHAMPASPEPTGAILVATDGRVLPLRRTTVQARAAGGLARVVLTQQFSNPHAEPLAVTYQVPLPADGAVSGYRFRIGDREVRGEIARRDDARERFVQAVMDGHTAALLEQDRSSVFTQELGNLPPGATLEVELDIDQPLTWIGERGGTWEWRFPTVVAPRYLGAAGRVVDAARITTHTTLDPLRVVCGLALTIDDVQHGIECPSHAVRITDAGPSTAVDLADADATLDRDLVVRWQVAGARAQAGIHRARPPIGHALAADAFARLTLVPPGVATAHVARDLIVLLDTSGSMSGAPLQQSQRLTCALIDRLDERDRLELFEFSTATRSWRREPVAATPSHRAEAKAWVMALHASGGTEMRTGIHAALASLRPEAQRQVVLVTDGQIGFESEIVAAIHGALPGGCRVHTIGVGSAVNRSLTAPAARAGRGIEIILGIDEDPERAVARLGAHTHAPLVVDVEIEGDALLEHAPIHLRDLMAEQPASIALRVRASGGTLRVRGRTAAGAWEQRLVLPATAHAEGNPAIVTVFGRERVEDLELRIAAGESGLDPRIEQTGLAFGIATRLTSWIAIDGIVGVDVGSPTRHEVMPQALPHGMSANGVGLRPASGGFVEQAFLGSAELAKPKASLIARTMRSMVRSESAPAPAAAAPPPPPARPRASAPAQGRAAPPPLPGSAGGAADGGAGESARRQKKKVAEERGPLAVKGDFVRLADGTLVIEFTAPDDGLEWTVPGELEVHLDTGATAMLAVDATRSTRTAHLGAGVRVRIVCMGAPTANVILAVTPALHIRA